MDWLDCSDKVRFAKDWGRKAHDSIQHKRKYTLVPYWTHTEAVALLTAQALYPLLVKGKITQYQFECAIIAALLHDVLEDVTPHKPEYGREQIRALFFDDVLYMVDALTHEFTKEKYPGLNREKRKVEEAHRLYLFGSNKFGDLIHSVKLADLIDNGKDIVVNDPNFAVTYLREKEYLLRLLNRGNRLLLEKAWFTLNWGYDELDKVKDR